MNRRIEIEQIEPEGGTTQGCNLETIDGGDAQLEGWLQALVQRTGVEGSAAQLWALSADAQPGHGDDLHQAAADLSIKLAGEGATPMAVAAGWALLKRNGYEPGRSSVQHWRINRVLNTGSRAVDLMVQTPQLRRLSLQTLFLRVLKTAIRRAEVGPRGVIAEVPGAVEWDQEAGEPLRRCVPAGSGKEAGEEVVEWLLDELVSRGLSSVTLGSVIEEGERRSWNIDDVFADWIAEMPADEARFVAGILFAPARLGGWERDEEEKLLDAMSVARRVDEEFVPDEARADAYQSYLQRIEKLRRIPEKLSPTFRLSDGTHTWRGRWGVSVHPARRMHGGDQGFFVMEAGFYFDEKRGGAASWPQMTTRSLRRELHRLVDAADEQVFGQFSDCLDAVVERLNRSPGWGGAESESVGSSPLWKDLDRGIEALVDAVDAGKPERVASLFRRWTVRCVQPR